MNRYIDQRLWEDFQEHVLTELIPPATIQKRNYREPVIRIFRLGRQDSGNLMATIIFTPTGIAIGGDVILSEETRGVWSDSGYGIDWFASNLDPHYMLSKFYREKFQKEVAARDLKETAKEILAGERHYEFHDPDDKDFNLEEQVEQKEEIEGRIRELRWRLDAWDLAAFQPVDDDTMPEELWRAIAAEREDLSTVTETIAGKRAEMSDRVREMADEVENFDFNDYGELYRKYEEVFGSYDGDGMPGWDYPMHNAHALVCVQRKFAELYRAQRFSEEESITALVPGGVLAEA